jgi:hypothetical protein
MDAKNKNLSTDKLDVRNFEPSSKTKVGQNGKTFHSKKRIMYRMGQDKKMHRCLITSEAQIILK